MQRSILRRIIDSVPTPGDWRAAAPVRQAAEVALRATWLLAGVFALVAAAPAAAQRAFPTPEAAADALVQAVAANDEDAVKAVLGADYRRVLPVRSDADERLDFLAAWARRHGVARRDERTAFLEIGESRWSMPIPIVQRSAGWSFDTRAAADEMRTRRIGRNELAAIKVALAYADAQEEYRLTDPDGDGVKTYATRLLSSPGRRDGLYWPALDGEAPSPLGPMMGLARRDRPFHGYLYRILTAQGPAAPGGATSYLQAGRMTEGFALVAWPASYGDSGVKTFIVARDGVVHEKDLGPSTAAIARAMRTYDPGAGWERSPTSD